MASKKEILLGNEAIVKGALEAGVDFVSGYPGCPAAEIGDIFGKIAKKENVYFEWSTNEKVALEAAIGASFSGLKCLVTMKSFGANVCSDSLLPLAYTGTKGPMVIVIGDDPSCWSSAQTEQDSRVYAFFGHIPMLEPSDPQEAKDFTKLAFEISEKFNTPVILRTTTRVAHQKMPVEISNLKSQKSNLKGEFVKNPHQFVTMPPRVLEMKKELLEKIKKIRAFAEKPEHSVKLSARPSTKSDLVLWSSINKIHKGDGSGNLGVITSGVSHLHTLEAMQELGIKLPVLKLGFFYPLPEKKIAAFIKGLKKLLVVEELDGYLEKEIKIIAKEINPKLQIFGKGLLPEIRELDSEKVIFALAKITGKKARALNRLSARPSTKFSARVPRRYPRLCVGCPYWYILPTIKKVAPDAVFGGDIGCYMIAGFPPHDIQDYLFSMGAGLGISHGVKKSTNQKVINLIGDGTFFHAGIPALINVVYNKSNPLIIVMDNRITAMTGHQPNPGMGKTGMGEDVDQIKIEDVARVCGVKHIKVLDPVNMQELEDTIKDFLNKEEVSLIICKRICALLAKRQAK